MLDLNSRANLMVATIVCPMLAFAFAFAGRPGDARLHRHLPSRSHGDARLTIVGIAALVLETASITMLLRQGPFGHVPEPVALVVAVALDWWAALRFGLAGAAAGSVTVIYLDRLVTLWRIGKLAGLPCGACRIALARTEAPVRDSRRGARMGRRRPLFRGSGADGSPRRRRRAPRRSLRGGGRVLRNGPGGRAVARLMFVTGCLFTGGAERHAVSVMSRLAERGHQCHAVSVKQPRGMGLRLPGAGPCAASMPPATWTSTP